jgi:hypothetical protein
VKVKGYLAVFSKQGKNQHMVEHGIKSDWILDL